MQFDGHGRADHREVAAVSFSTDQRENRGFCLAVFCLAFLCFPRKAFALEMRIERIFDASDGGLWGINTS